MVDLDEMMDKINNINSRVEELYSKEVYNNKEALNSIYGVNSDCYLKSCIAQQAKEITLLTRQVDNQKKEINLLLKQKDKLKKKLEACESHRVDMLAYRDNVIGMITSEKNDLKQELEKVRSERETIKALNEQLKADFDVLAKNHKELGEQYHDLQRQLCAEIKSLKETISTLKTDIKYSNTRYANKTIEFNRLNGEYHDLKQEYDNLVKAADKYSWKRVDCLTTSTLEDHCLYLFAVDGYPTPVKGKFHADGLSNITVIVDDGKGKGPEQKTIFFMDGHIRYWTPLPEMPDMPKGVDDYD